MEQTLPTRQAYRLFAILLLLFMATALKVRSQSTDPQVFRQGVRYIEANTHSLDRFSERATRIQSRLLKRLARKERRYASELRRKDSAAYARYQLTSTPSFDSILTLSHPDSATLSTGFSHSSQSVIDSLKGVERFLQTSASGISGNTTLNAAQQGQLSAFNSDIKALQAKLNYQQYIDGLISSRTTALQNLRTNNSQSFPALNGIQKEVFYAKSKLASWRELADNPDKAEEKALEYLQGQDGFEGTLDKAVNGDNAGNSAGGATGAGNSLSAADLEKMGYQTKRMTAAALQKQFGANLSAMQGQVGKQVAAWQDKATSISGGLKDVKEGLNTVGGIKKPAIRLNPMRGLPFWQRIEKGYSFNTQRAQGVNPALLNVAVTAGFRYSPSLSFGLGIATDIGLGQSFSSIHLSFQGAGVRSYLSWQAIWGIGVYGGYERMYKRVFFTGKRTEITAALTPSVHNTTDYSESVLLGLTKSYHINSKYNGAVQLLYDFWWKEKNLNSPIILRFTTQTK